MQITNTSAGKHLVIDLQIFAKELICVQFRNISRNLQLRSERDAEAKECLVLLEHAICEIVGLEVRGVIAANVRLFLEQFEKHLTHKGDLKSDDRLIDWHARACTGALLILTDTFPRHLDILLTTSRHRKITKRAFVAAHVETIGKELRHWRAVADVLLEAVEHQLDECPTPPTVVPQEVESGNHERTLASLTELLRREFLERGFLAMNGISQWLGDSEQVNRQMTDRITAFFQQRCTSDG